MNSHPKHGLKIADTPTEDEAAEVSSNTLSISAPAPEVPESIHSSSTGSDQNEKKLGEVQRLTPAEMEDEIDRVKRLNGIPRLALDTCQDE